MALRHPRHSVYAQLRLLALARVAVLGTQKTRMTHGTFQVRLVDRTHIMVSSLVINWSMTKNILKQTQPYITSCASGRHAVEAKGCRFMLSEGDMVKAAKGKDYRLLDWEFGTLPAK
ncbi:hypothetical protein TRIUR3_12643 [Triticum urartu]|uniref:Uncharacterized protein n=3 Tax=Triticum TaxID=4564 RepID=A0A9R0RW50_TRITD|nr:hypothetical protein TRIUR3_12643 [Triticum urartu]VAH67276.1 unnamed protein product [Triticum turgidum subsp. durum]